MTFKLNNWIMTFGLAFFACGAYAADVSIKNNTKAFVTGEVNAICSSMVGEPGILAPGTVTIVPQIVFDLYCPTTCEAKVFANRSCQGSPIATVQVSHDQGVVSVSNTGLNGFFIAGRGKNVSIEGGNAL